jgi:transposase InsO family protein
VYYYHLHNEEHSDEKAITEKIKGIKEENPAYGYRRVTLELQNQGFDVNHKKVQRIMQEENLQSTAYGKKTRKYNSYKGTVGTIAPNRLNRRFMTDRPLSETDSGRYRIALGGSVHGAPYVPRTCDGSVFRRNPLLQSKSTSDSRVCLEAVAGSVGQLAGSALSDYGSHRSGIPISESAMGS